MATMNWDRIEEANKNNKTKEYIETLLLHLENEDLVVSLTQEFVSSVVDTNSRSVGLRLIVFRILFSALPVRIFGKLVVPYQVLDWLCAIIQNPSDHSHSVRGGAISVFGLIVRHFPVADTFDLKKFAVGLGISIRDAADDLCRDISETTASCSPGAIILHQIVNALAVIADSSLPWLTAISDYLPAAAFILHRVSGWSSAQGGRLQVDAAKVFSLVAEVWLEQKMAASSRSESVARCHCGYRTDDASAHDGIVSMCTRPSLADIPVCVFQMVSSGPVLHDSLLGAYQLAVELNVTLQAEATTQPTSPPESVDDQVRPDVMHGQAALQWVEKVEERVRELLLSLLQCDVEASALMDIKRIESLLGVLASWFDIRSARSEAAPLRAQDVSDWLAAADRTLQLQVCTMGQLKKFLSVSQVATSAVKSCRAAASDVRKGCIALSHSVFSACPSYLRSSQFAHAGEEGFFKFSLQCLGTPLLFSVAYTSLIATAYDGESQLLRVGEITAGEVQRFIVKMVRHLSAGLSQTTRYSAASAGDILTATEDLAGSGCVELLQLSDSGDLPLMVLDALQASPKGLAKGSSQKQQVAKGEVDGINDWKIRCLAALHTLIQLAASRSSPMSKFSSQFKERFVLVFVEDIRTVRRCLGILLPAEVGELRPAAIAVTKKIYGTTDAEVLIPVLHALVNTLSGFLNLFVQEHSASEPVDWGLHQDALRNLLELTRDVTGTATRPLLFDDDCALCCSELELISRAIVVLAGLGGDGKQCVAEVTQSVVAVLSAGAGASLTKSKNMTYGSSSSMQHHEQLVRDTCETCMNMLREANIADQLS